jgi:O-antigen ligase
VTAISAPPPRALRATLVGSYAVLVLALGAGTAYVASFVGPLTLVGVVAVLAVVAITLSRPLELMCLAVLTLPLESVHVPIADKVGLSISESLFLLVGIGIMWNTVRGRLRLRLMQPLALFGCFLVVAFAGVFVAPSGAPLLKTVLFWSIGLLLASALAGATASQLERLLLGVVVGAGILGVTAVLTNGSQSVRGGGQFILDRAQGDLGQPNILAFYFVLALPVALALAGEGTRWRRTVAFVSAVSILSGLMATFSRSGLLSAALGLVIVCFSRRTRAAVLALLVVAVCAASLIQGGTLLTAVTKRVSTVQSSATFADNPRLRVWRFAPTVIAAHPVLGVGLESFPSVSARAGVMLHSDLGQTDDMPRPFPHAHDLVLQLAATTGLLGAGLFISFALSVLVVGLSGIRKYPSGRSLRLALIACFAGFLAMGIADYPLTAPHSVVIILLLEVGALLVVAQRARPAVILPTTSLSP